MGKTSVRRKRVMTMMGINIWAYRDAPEEGDSRGNYQMDESMIE